MHAESRRCNLISTTFITNLNGQFRVLPFSRARTSAKKRGDWQLVGENSHREKRHGRGARSGKFCARLFFARTERVRAGPPGVPGGLQGHTWVHFLPLSSRQPAGAQGTLSQYFLETHTHHLCRFLHDAETEIYTIHNKRRNNIMEHAAGVCRVQASRGATLATYLHSSSALILME